MFHISAVPAGLGQGTLATSGDTFWTSQCVLGRGASWCSVRRGQAFGLPPQCSANHSGLVSTPTQRKGVDLPSQGDLGILEKNQ